MILATLTTGALLIGCGSDGGPVEGPTYKADLPSGWEEGSTAALGLGLENKIPGVDLEVAWVRQDKVDGIAANVNVLSGKRPAAELEAVARAQRNATGSQQAAEDAGLGGALNVTELGDLEKTTLGGDPAFSFEFTNAPQQGTLRQRAIIAYHGDRGYNVTLTAAESDYEDRQDDFNAILASFEWTD